MTILVLGAPCSGKKTFIQKIGGIETQRFADGVDGIEYNIPYVDENAILLTHTTLPPEKRALENVTQIFVIIMPYQEPFRCIDFIKKYIGLDNKITVLINQYDIVQKHKNNYLMKSLFNSAYKIKVNNLLNKLKNVKNTLKEQNISCYNISCVGMTTDEIYNILVEELFPNRHAHFRNAAEIEA